MKSEYVQYGCGLCAPLDWRNFDASPTLRLQRIPLLGLKFRGSEYPLFPPNVEYGDITKGLPIEAGSCQAIYCSHTLEHLSLEECRRALAQTFSYLKSGGLFRFVLPDLEFLARSYLAATESGASLRFMEETLLGRRFRPRGLKNVLRHWMGNSAHLWMWDFKAIAVELEHVGFRNIRRAQYGDSQEPRFVAVEDIERWRNALGVECSR
jgi:hypothetical protein